MGKKKKGTKKKVQKTAAGSKDDVSFDAVKFSESSVDMFERKDMNAPHEVKTRRKPRNKEEKKVEKRMEAKTGAFVKGAETGKQVLPKLKKRSGLKKRKMAVKKPKAK